MQPALNWLTDPTVFRVNRLDAHSDHICYASAREAAQGGIPMGRLGAPEDVAQAVGFLAGDGAAYITGQVLAVDGGMSM